MRPRLFWPRKGRRAAETGWMIWRFNEAAAVLAAEGGAGLLPHDAEWRSFNEAAAVLAAEVAQRIACFHLARMLQ